MKCYIIFYQWKRNGENVWTPTQTITIQHPLDWLIETQNHFQVSLVNWKEEIISKDRFKYIEDNIN